MALITLHRQNIHANAPSILAGGALAESSETESAHTSSEQIPNGAKGRVNNYFAPFSNRQFNETGMFYQLQIQSLMCLMQALETLLLLHIYTDDWLY